MNATSVSAAEVNRMLEQGAPVTFVDARNPTAWGESAVKLPGAIRVPADEVDRQLDEIPRDGTIITYCT
jgi:rhodanese-related sulfurtransferase